MFLLDHIKRSLKDDCIATARYDEAFRRLKSEILAPDCDLYNDTVIIQSRYNETNRAGHLGTIDYGEKDRSFNNIAEALVWLVDEIETDNLIADWKKEIEKHVAIPEYHVFTCDRFDQNDQFQLALLDAETKKIHHFYLYGDARQAHESLHQRLGRDLGGHLLNWEEGDYEPETKILFKSLKPSVHRHPVLYRREVIRTLFARFFPKINEKEPLDSKTVADLLHSPDLSGFGPGDLVFVLLTMDDANWNKEVTPVAVEHFIGSFLKTTLPDSAPRFFFFFGIEYEKASLGKQEEVRTAIQNRTHGGEALDELKPVGADDITEWFSRYRKIMLERGKEPKEMTAAFFGPAKLLDMNEIEAVLFELISRHNKGLAIRSENLKKT
ncbi:MAG: hypothetical protein JNJ90_11305 [Saprospiraceae bacterium]|jgi:hypothetical protein|nr:hypothetical protein [Saprospiraceae bacterium]